jgi:hypothetical protein
LYSYSQSKARIYLDEGLEIGGVQQFDDFVSCILDFGQRFQRMTDNMMMIWSSLQAPSKAPDADYDETTSEDAIAINRTPANVACTTATIGIRGARESMNKLHSGFLSYGSAVERLFLKMQHDMDVLRFEAFRKEKDIY